jgi:cell division control protein 12
LRKRFTEQVKVEEQRFRTWEQKLIGERDRLNKDLESTHAAYVSPTLQSNGTNACNSIKQLEQELEQMQGSAVRSHGRGR